jgi:mono/diheme cytochrome c family protein
MLGIWNQRLGTFLMAAVVVSPAFAQSDIADPSRGRELAESHCSVCHNVSPYPGGGMASGVPSFFSIGNRPDQAPSRLAGAIVNSHPEAPKLSFHLGELRDIIAYIMSLKAKE